MNWIMSEGLKSQKTFETRSNLPLSAQVVERDAATDNNPVRQSDEETWSDPPTVFEIQL